MSAPAYTEFHDEPEPVTVLGEKVDDCKPPAYTPSLPQPPVVYVVQTVPQRQPGWQHSIFECFRSLPNCLSAWCFPCWRTALSGGRSGILSCWFLFSITFGLWLLMMVNDTLYKRAIYPEIENVVTSCKLQSFMDPQFDASSFTSAPLSADQSAACQESTQQLVAHVLPYFGAFICLVLSKLLIACVVRGRIRAKYEIPGSACEDLCCHMFCHTCAVAQEGYTVDMLELGQPSPFALSAEVPQPTARSVTAAQVVELGRY